MRYNVAMPPAFPKLTRSARSLRDAFVELARTSFLYRWTAIASGVLVVLSAALPAWRILPIAGDRPYIPLHYNVYVGIDSFGPWYGIFVLPALGLGLLVVNTAFQAVFYRREHILSVFFAVATVATELVLFVATVLIVLMNL